MDTTKIIKGDDLMVFANEKSIAFATSHTLTLSAATQEISCKDSGMWNDTLVNKLSWEATSDNLYSMGDYQKLAYMMTHREKVYLVFGTASNSDPNGIDSPTAYWVPATGGNSGSMTGYAFITNLTANAASGDNATFSVTFQGIGALTSDYTIE